MLTISLFAAACRSTSAPAPEPEPAPEPAPEPSARAMRFGILGDQTVILPDPEGRVVVVEMVRSIDW
ncbi:MAG TPA: hypothetical protein ENK18_11165 [Deltaproteobacteria bacterium]|nr:hypothetical protein [Deltaproteobacteria bacterium]